MSNNKIYTLKEGLQFVAENAKAKFKESVDLAIVLSTKENIRGVVKMPYPVIRQIRIIAFVSSEQAENARNAGADLVGGEELISSIKDNKKLVKGFQYCVTARSLMPSLSKIAKILGPKGLMPNPKWGTVSETEDVTEAVEEIKQGKMLFKSDKHGIIHLKVGNLQASTSEQLLGNIQGFWRALKEIKPKTVKGNFIARAYINSTMGRAYPINVKELEEL